MGMDPEKRHGFNETVRACPAQSEFMPAAFGKSSNFFPAQSQHLPSALRYSTQNHT
jgi:hypothetical protein